MSNDDKVKVLEKHIPKLSYSDGLPTKRTSKPNKAALLELAKTIRERVEDYSVDTATHPNPSQ